MPEDRKTKSFQLARDKFLGFNLESSRKSYYPQLLNQLEEARNNEERLQLLIDNLPARIAFINMEEKYVLVNEEYKKTFNKKKEEIIGTPAREVVGETNYRTLKPFMETVMSGREVVFETEILDYTGARLWNEISYIPVFDSAGNIAGVYILARDLTEKKRIEHEKKNIEQKLFETAKHKAIGTLAGGVAHDFNNLLMGIQGNASLLEAKLGESNPLLEHVKAINAQVKSATSLTRQLLGISRGGKYEVKSIDIIKLVKYQANMFSRTTKSLTIHHKYHQNEIIVDVDKNQLEQVLLNLFINASQAMPGGGEIFIEGKVLFLDKIDCEAHNLSQGLYASIAITDTGCGMTKEVSQRVFDPFFTTKDKQRGTGLGLASAYGIIQNHSGLLKVYSEPDQGSTFIFYLPVSGHSAHEDIDNLQKCIPGKGNILLVDDEEFILDVGQKMLETIGYRVTTATSGIDAVNYVKKAPSNYDLVLIDMIMPRMNGLTTYANIRKIAPSIPVILSTGYSISGQAEEITSLGCDGFLQKPYNIVEMSLKLHEVLQRNL